MMKKNITFFYPSTIVGGAEYLFIRLAKHLAHLGHDVSVVDLKQGFLSRELQDTPVQLIPYEKDIPIVIPENTHLILTSMLLFNFTNLQISNLSKILI